MQLVSVVVLVATALGSHGHKPAYSQYDQTARQPPGKAPSQKPVRVITGDNYNAKPLVRDVNRENLRRLYERAGLDCTASRLELQTAMRSGNSCPERKKTLRSDNAC